MRRKSLTKEKIAGEALKLIDRVGLQGFSARKLAARLKVQAMSLYHHFPSQAHLLDAVMDQLISGLPNPLDYPDTEENGLMVMRAYRDLARRHPKFFPYVVMHRWNTPATLRYLEGLLSIYVREGFDMEMTVRLFRIFGYFLGGCAIEENAELRSAAEPVSLDEQRVKFPLVYEAAPWFQGHRDDAFELGMKTLISSMKDLPRRAR
ncbi:MAG TPA: TetR/AcrR family transcriptional regulator C-terminal domain-containing protein [Myxococcales bacterium]|nr:TetR/AcrR family transcriptional regulator C-terminal domain-containing protein [Myxococcales bacterium]